MKAVNVPCMHRAFCYSKTEERSALVQQTLDSIMKQLQLCCDVKLRERISMDVHKIINKTTSKNAMCIIKKQWTEYRKQQKPKSLRTRKQEATVLFYVQSTLLRTIDGLNEMFPCNK